MNITDTEVTIESLESRLARTAGEMIVAFLSVAQSRFRASGDAEALAALGSVQTCRLVIEVRGPELRVDLMTPDADGRAVRLFGLTAKQEGVPCSRH